MMTSGNLINREANLRSVIRMPWWYMHGGGWLNIILGLAFWLLIAVVIVLLIRWVTTQNTFGVIEEESPMEILGRRYARGEITREQFLQMKEDIERASSQMHPEVG